MSATKFISLFAAAVAVSVIVEEVGLGEFCNKAVAKEYFLSQEKDSVFLFLI